jgi:hypothetical protein
MKVKEDIKKFVTAIMDKNYKKADTHLNDAVNKKIKQRIINNNNNLF